jgi:hypothetical protein
MKSEIEKAGIPRLFPFERKWQEEKLVATCYVNN